MNEFLWKREEGAMKKRYLLMGLLVLVIAVALVAVACGGGGEATTTEGSTTTVTYPAGTSTGPIKVGHIFDSTGNEAIVGALFKLAIQYVFTDASVAGRPIEIIEADAKSTTEGAVEAARKLVEQDKVDIIFGPTQIGQKNAVATYCAEKQVPMVLYNPTPPGALEENEWVIGVGGLTPEYGTSIADYMYNDLGYRTISTLGPEDSSGHAFFQPLADYFTALGGQVVQQQWAVGQTDDWSAYLTTVETADALVAWVGGSGGPLLTSYYDTGVYKKIPLVGAFHGGFLDPWVPKNIGEGNKDAARALIGIKTVMAWNPDNTSTVNADYVAGFSALGFKAEDGGPSGPVQAGMVLLKALESCATNLSNVALRDAILAIDMEGPEGRVFFAPGDNISTKPMYIVEVALLDPASHPTDPRDLYKYVLVKTYDAVPPHGLTK
jgi:branched-chain amino acid transport system substrate-binding protein